MNDPEFFDIQQLKTAGMWPLSFLPAYGMIPYINRIRSNPIKGIEVGVLKGENAYVLLESCPSLHLTGIDPYLEYFDIDHTRTQVDMDRYKEIADKNLMLVADRYTLIQESSLAQRFEDESFDFVLLDSIQSKLQVEAELELYFPTLKKGGYIFVHDTQIQDVMIAIKTFRADKKIRTPLLHSKNFVGFWQK